MSLAPFLHTAILSIHDAGDRISRFIELRYHALATAFPHGTFSVAQASPDFFEVALVHLEGAPFVDAKGEPAPDRDQSEYELNYRRWIRQHRSRIGETEGRIPS